MKLAGRVALVTGGAARVGAAIGRALAAEGAAVAITYHRSAAEAEILAAELRATGPGAVAVPCDQRVPEQIATALVRAEDALGPLDLLVNNASTFSRRDPELVSVEEWEEDLKTNLRGPWLFARSAGFAMKRRGQGVVVNIVDAAWERPYPSYLPYSVAKAGLVAVTCGLARALAPEVRVVAVAPGHVLWPDERSEEERAALLKRVPLGRVGNPSDVAGAVVYAATAEYVTGAILTVDGGRRLG